MAKQSINVGTTANDKKGDSLRAAFQKVNANFTELYTALGLAADTTLNFGNFVFESNTVRLTNANNDDSTATQIEIAQPVRIESDLTVGGDIVPNTANGGDLGSPAKPFRSLYVSNNTIFIGGTAVGVDADGNLTTGGTVVGSTPAWDNITGKPSFATVSTTGAYADLTGKPTIPTSFSSLVNGVYTLGLGADGALNLPSSGGESGSIKSSVNNINLAVTDINGDRSGVYLSQEAALVYGADRTIIRSNSAGDLLDWTFDIDGSLTIPGDIKSEGNINIDINLSDSTLRRWQFGEDGGLTFPDNTVQTTAWTGTASVLARTTVSATTASLADGATADATITGFKGYLLYKIQTSAAAWVRVYTDVASRTADLSRSELTDPASGAGVIAEVITTGAQTVLISPGTLGFSNESSPDTNIQIAVTNKSGSSAAITVTLTVVQLEA